MDSSGASCRRRPHLPWHVALLAIGGAVSSAFAGHAIQLSNVPSDRTGVTFEHYDGDLDLYVANYVQFSYDKHVPRTKRGYPVYGSPVDQVITVTESALARP